MHGDSTVLVYISNLFLVYWLSAMQLCKEHTADARAKVGYLYTHHVIVRVAIGCMMTIGRAERLAL